MKRRFRVSPLYRSQFLLNELLPLAAKQDKNAFVDFQAKVLTDRVKDPFFEHIAVNVLKCAGGVLVPDEYESAVWGISPRIIDNYERCFIYDEYTPRLFTEPGSAVFNEAVMPLSAWRDTSIYTEHRIKFGYESVCEIAYNFHFGLVNPKIVFFFARPRGYPFPISLTEEMMEYVCFPFVIGWLLVYRQIDVAHAQAWLARLVGLSQTKFEIVRGLFQSDLPMASCAAEKLGIAPKAVHRHFDQLAQSLYKSGDDEWLTHTRKRQLRLMQTFDFMKFGASRHQRALPQRQSHFP